MAGSHEVRGSNPLFSTMNSIAGRTIGQRFFYLQARGLELREVLCSRRFLFDGFSSFGGLPLGISRFSCQNLPFGVDFVGIPRFLCHVREAGVAGRVRDAHCGGQPGFAPLLSCLFVPVALQSCFLTRRNN